MNSKHVEQMLEVLLSKLAQYSESQVDQQVNNSQQTPNLINASKEPTITCIGRKKPSKPFWAFNKNWA